MLAAESEVILKMVVLKLTDLLLLFLITERTSAKKYDCMNQGYLLSCTSDNPRVRINKDDNHYTLTLCFNNTMSCFGGDMPHLRINCDRVCEICRSLLGSQSSRNNKNECENQVDMFLNSHCESAEVPTNVLNMMTTPSLTNQARITDPITTTVLATLLNRQSNSEATNNSPAVVALSILFSISLVLLAVVTTGWVCTCLIMKKREVANSSAYKGSSADYEENYVQDPTYGRIAGGSLIGASTYETVNTSQETAENYNALNRGQASGQTTAMAAQSTTGDGNYSQLGPRDCEV